MFEIIKKIRSSLKAYNYRLKYSISNLSKMYYQIIFQQFILLLTLKLSLTVSHKYLVLFELVVIVLI